MAVWGLTVAVSAVVSAAVYYAPLAGLGFLGPPWHVTLGGLAGVLAAAAMPIGPAPLAADVGGTAAAGGAARAAERRG